MYDRFIGWIPNISGRLSFEVIGGCKWPTPAVSRNFLSKNGRIIVSHQKRIGNLDPVIPFAKQIMPIMFSESGDIWFAFVGYSNWISENRDEVIFGRIFIFNGTDRWRNTAESEIHKLQKLVDQERLSDSAPGLSSVLEKKTKNGPHWKNEAKETMINLSSRCSYFINVRISRNGIIKLRTTKNNFNQDRFLIDPRNIYPINSMNYIVARQCYYFIRDICHTHQHHDPRTDTIVTIHQENNGLDWTVETARNLSRKIIDRRRNFDGHSAQQTLGILAYGKSFAKTILDRNVAGAKERNYSAEPSENLSYNEEIIRSELHPVFKTFFQEEIEQSLSARFLDAQHNVEEARKNWEERRSIVFGLFGIIISIIGLMSLTNIKIDKENVSAHLISIAEITIEFPLIFIVPILLILFFNSIFKKFELSNTWRLILILSHGFSRNKSAILIFIISIALIILGIDLLLWGVFLGKILF